MSSESPTLSSNPTSTPVSRPTLLRLFIEFAKISTVGFGGVLVWTRRSVVEKHGWMTADEFNEAFAISQFLPGPNAINFSVVFGSRLRGPIGGLVVFLGLLGPPAIIVVVIAVLYSDFANVVALQRVLHGISCAAIGLFSSALAKMVSPLLKRKEVLPIVVLLAVFVSVGLLRWPMPFVLLTAVPASLLVTYLARRHDAASGN